MHFEWVGAGYTPRSDMCMRHQSPNVRIRCCCYYMGDTVFKLAHFEAALLFRRLLFLRAAGRFKVFPRNLSRTRGLGDQQVYVEGILIGDCSCNKMQIRFAGCVTGNLICASLGMDPSVVLKVGFGISCAPQAMRVGFLVSDRVFSLRRSHQP